MLTEITSFFVSDLTVRKIVIAMYIYVRISLVRWCDDRRREREKKRKYKL